MFNKRTVVRNVLLAIILGSLMILVPTIYGLGKGGFQKSEILSQYNFYELGISFLILVVAIFFLELYITKGDEKYGSSVAFNSPGETPSPRFMGRITGLQLFLLSLIILSSLGLYNFLTQQQVFTGVGVLQQQFTKTDNLIFSLSLVTISENAGGALVIALSLMSLRFLGRKYNLSKSNFVVFSYLFIPFILGIYGVINHLSRGYGDVSLFTVFIFWTVGGFLTIFFGSFIPFWVAHIDNNLFYDLQKYFSVDTAKGSMIILIIALIILYLWIYNPLKKRKPYIEKSAITGV